MIGVDNTETGASVPQMETFTFETITLDKQGTIIQTRAHQAGHFVEVLPGDVTLAMVAIPAGRFLMGSRTGIGYDDERPQHSVSVPAFFMSQCPVTQAQWEAVMRWTPPYRCKGVNRPVDRVNWHNAVAFCERLSELTGRVYCLPAEAEWEYACRAGT
ncbi:MAG: formylglycine-generating enzyme family protein, partial [Anaerolineae bacterium]|nr:formylglycine-generating enzyme family protein [Anaerolineae bacterium]